MVAVKCIIVFFIVFSYLHAASGRKAAVFSLDGNGHAISYDKALHNDTAEIARIVADYVKTVDGKENDESEGYLRQLHAETETLSRDIVENAVDTMNSVDDFYMTVLSKYNNLSFRAPIGRGTYWDMTEPISVIWWGTAPYTDTIPGITIGRYCSIAQNVKFMLDGNHCYSTVSTYSWDSQFLYSPQVKNDKYAIYRVHDRPVSQCAQSAQLRPITIGNDVWIGSDVTLMMGTTIGDGAVIGAHSVVRGHVEPYSIVLGNPAARSKYRFKPELISALLKIQWWNWSVDVIASNMDLFTNEASDNIEAFVRRAGEINATGSEQVREVVGAV